MTDSETKPSGGGNLLGRLFLVGFGLLVALGAGELVLRLRPSLLPEEALLRLHWSGLEPPDTITVAHPICGYVHKPLESHVMARTDFSFTLEADGHGFRNPWPWPETAPVVVVGDSMAFSYGVDHSEMWTTLVSRHMDGAAVINLGIDGGAPRQALRIYEEFGRKPKPKVVLFGLFPGNDYLDERTFERWLASGDGGNYAVWRWYGGKQSPGLKQLLSKSYLIVGLREARKSYDFEGLTIQNKDGGLLRLAPGLVEGAIPPNVKPEDEERVYNTVAEARDIVEADGAKFVALLFPTKEEIYLAAQGEPYPDGLGPMLKGLEERDIECIDLRQVLRERARAGETLYFETDGHPNAAGYVVIASVVAEYLEEHGLK